MSSLTQSSSKLIEWAKSRSMENSLNQKALEAFLKQGLPSPKHEAFKYFKLGGLFQKDFQENSMPVDEAWIQSELQKIDASSVLVIYNGQYLPQFSRIEKIEDQLVILPLDQAAIEYDSFVVSYFEQWIEKEKDPFALFALLMKQDGLFVYVPKNTQLSDEVILLELSDSKKTSETQMNVNTSKALITLGQNAHLKCSSIFKSRSSATFNSRYVGFQIDQNASIAHAVLNEESKGYSFESIRVQQKKDSQFKWIQTHLKPEKSRSSFHVQLLESGCSSEILGLLALKQKEQAHIHILMEHLAPHCYSRQLFKHLLSEESLSSFEGKIYIESEAQQTNAYQLNQNCLLSDEATAYSKPNLEIFADDVKASHGSTTGQIDQDQLFYLQSRGLSKKRAQHLLLRGFCDEVLEYLEHPKLKSMMSQKIQNYFSELL